MQGSDVLDVQVTKASDIAIQLSPQPVRIGLLFSRQDNQSFYVSMNADQAIYLHRCLSMMLEDEDIEAQLQPYKEAAEERMKDEGWA